MLAAQHGKCAICGGNRSIKDTFRLGIDHDHATGRIRGLLCGNCNIGLGHFDDSPGLLEKAADYLRSNRREGAA